jgi:DUF438 domain-containing protein
MLELLKSVMEQDSAPVVICDTASVIVYMNPAAKVRYRADLTGKSLKDCHPPRANAAIDRVLDWFRESPDHNRVYTFRNDRENKDVYMIALRSSTGELIGYYEKHEYRNRETGKLYDLYD